MMRAAWKFYCCLIRESFSLRGSLREIFVARFALLSIHAAVVLVLMWWIILARFAWFVVRMVAA